MAKGDDKSNHPINNNHGVQAFKAAIQAHDERMARGFQEVCKFKLFFMRVL